MKIKRFFTELRYKEDHDIPIIETCTIIERSCAFCPGQYDILHPMNGKYLSGKRVPAMEWELAWRWPILLELPFTGRQRQPRRRFGDLGRGTGLLACSDAFSTRCNVSFTFCGHLLPGRLFVEANKGLMQVFFSIDFS
ncbi:hypothetical protein BAE44_0019511 [Dichanthelium oligosanthes]|uniref:Uncharacterized protein n=1 Tax=Dichanthelium oligosanthes TaxID=888268 RepID=A0A1E5V304_9POAL|nr:hypothetical protein BAE44_0019511 [Dichanthelium oligosanthes]